METLIPLFQALDSESENINPWFIYCIGAFGLTAITDVLRFVLKHQGRVEQADVRHPKYVQGKFRHVATEEEIWGDVSPQDRGVLFHQDGSIGAVVGTSGTIYRTNPNGDLDHSELPSHACYDNYD